MRPEKIPLKKIAPALATLLCALIPMLLLAPKPAQSAPQICYSGYELLGDDDRAALDALTQCVENNDLTNAARATAHYHRGLAQWNLFWGAKTPDDDRLAAARRDMDAAIGLKPLYADAFCLRGRIDLELSLGMNGAGDLKAGRTLGGSDTICKDE